MKYFLPNFITAINLFCGILGIIEIMKGNLQNAIWAMYVGLLCDFVDGLVARLISAYSEFGKQLDSLADLITFGVLPTCMLYMVFEQKNSFLVYLILLYGVFSGLRLAKFNVDTRQSDSFVGLPTPASALCVVGFLAYIEVYPFLKGTFIFLGFVLLLCGFMVAELPLFALKFKTFGLKENFIRYIFLLISFILVIFLQYFALLPLIGWYIFLSLIDIILKNYNKKT
jgi:CDP-diacylglycerol---serine O-phosphatidyltransferase